MMRGDEIVTMLNEIGNLCIISGVFNNIDDVRRLISIIDHFEKMDYRSYNEYDPDFTFLYDLSEKLQKSGKISLEMAYRIYLLLLTLDTVSFGENVAGSDNGDINTL